MMYQRKCICSIHSLSCLSKIIKQMLLVEKGEEKKKKHQHITENNSKIPNGYCKLLRLITFKSKPLKCRSLRTQWRLNFFCTEYENSSKPIYLFYGFYCINILKGHLFFHLDNKIIIKKVDVWLKARSMSKLWQCLLY